MAATLQLRRHRFDGAFAAPTPPAPLEPSSDDTAPVREPPRNPVLAADGAPIGMRRYCELVTPSYTWDVPHLLHIDAVLDRVTSGELKRVIFSLPTQIGKTEKITVRYPAMRLELDPTTTVLVTAYNDAFAQKLSRKVRRLVNGRVPLSRERNSAQDWETEAGGGVRAAGVGVGIAGIPAKLLMVDDPTKSREDAYSRAHRDRVWEWLIEDAYTRVDPDGAIIITMARRHEDDAVGRILAGEGADEWTVVRLPALAEADDPLGRAEGEALWPARKSVAYYTKLRRDQGEAAFASLQQQRPAPASGLVFKSDWFRFYTTREHPIIENGVAVPFLPDVFTEELQSWDMSFKDKATSDYVAGHTWRRKAANCYLLPDRVHDRLDFPATITAVRALTKRHPKAMRKLVEDKANGPAVIAALRNEIPGIVAVEPEGDKVARAHSVTALFEAGNVWLPHPAIAPWVSAFKLELLQFPLGAHDDDVDACTQALRRFMRHMAIEDQGDGGDASPSISSAVG